MKTLLCGAIILLTIAIVVSCAGGTTPDTSTAPAAEPASLNATTLARSLRTAGLNVQDAGTVQQPFFTVPAQVYQVEGRDLQVYEFATPADAERAASQVAPTGSPIGTSMVTWMAPPHFFRKDRLIANYIGTSDKVLSELQRIFGPQFAGR